MDTEKITIEVLECAGFEPYNNAPWKQTVGYLLVEDKVKEIIISAQQSVHLTALRMWLAVSISINVGLLIVFAVFISGR